MLFRKICQDFSDFPGAGRFCGLKRTPAGRTLRCGRMNAWCRPATASAAQKIPSEKKLDNVFFFVLDFRLNRQYKQNVKMLGRGNERARHFLVEQRRLISARQEMRKSHFNDAKRVAGIPVDSPMPNRIRPHAAESETNVCRSTDFQLDSIFKSILSASPRPDIAVEDSRPRK